MKKVLAFVMCVVISISSFTLVFAQRMELGLNQAQGGGINTLMVLILGIIGSR